MTRPDCVSSNKASSRLPGSVRQDPEAFNWTLYFANIGKRGGGVKNAPVWLSRAIDARYRYAVSPPSENKREV